MKQLYGLVAGVGLGAVIQACATATFPYPSYGVDMQDQMLLADTTHGLPDQKLTICDASEASKSPCVVYLLADDIALKTDYLNTKNELQLCQQRLNSL